MLTHTMTQLSPCGLWSEMAVLTHTMTQLSPRGLWLEMAVLTHTMTQLSPRGLWLEMAVLTHTMTQLSPCGVWLEMAVLTHTMTALTTWPLVGDGWLTHTSHHMASGWRWLATTHYDTALTMRPLVGGLVLELRVRCIALLQPEKGVSFTTDEEIENPDIDLHSENW